MTKPIRALRHGLILGALVLIAAPVRADGIDADKLVRFTHNQAVTVEDWVATEPVSTAVVKKIEAGKVSYVTIATTATGTYSSDGIASPNVQYPGINKTANPRNSFTFFSWNNGSWSRLSTRSGQSFVSISSHRGQGGAARGTTCISTSSFFYC